MEPGFPVCYLMCPHLGDQHKLQNDTACVMECFYLHAPKAICIRTNGSCFRQAPTSYRTRHIDDTGFDAERPLRAYALLHLQSSCSFHFC